MQINQTSSENPGLSNQPIKHYVHHSYIWLGSLRSFIYFIWALIIGGISSIAGLVAGDEAPDFNLISDRIIGPGIIFALLAVFLILIYAIVLFVHWISYKHLYYVISPNEFNLYSGIFVKKHVHIPYDRVQSVDLRASLLQRIFGVRTIYIDTAGGESNKAVIVPYVALSEAESLRNELYARKETGASGVITNLSSVQPDLVQAKSNTDSPAQPNLSPSRGGNILDEGADAWRQVGGVFAGDLQDADKPSFEVKLTNKELIFSALSNSGGFIVMLMAFVAFVFQSFGFLFDYASEQVNELAFVSSFNFMDDSSVLTIVVIVTALIFIFMLVLYAIFIGTQCLNYGGFRARRTSERIEVEHGLLQHTAKSVSISRVQAVVIKQTVIRKLIGYCEISLDKVDASSSDDKSQEKELNPTGIVIHPFCKLSDVSEIIQNLVPEFVDAPKDIVPVAPQAKRRAIIRNCIWQGVGFWTFAFTAIAQSIFMYFTVEEIKNCQAIEDSSTLVFAGIADIVFGALYIISVIAIILAFIDALMWSKNSGAAFNSGFFKIVNGGLTHTERSIPRNKIQYGETMSNPFQRISGVVSLKARTAAGIGGTSVKIWDMSATEGEAWLKWLEPRVEKRAQLR